MTRTQKIVIAALAAIAAAIIPLWTPAPATWGLDNTAPVINTPTSTSLEYLFPRGEKAVLQFGSEPVTDDDGDTATPRFVFTVPNVDTTDNADTIETDNEAELSSKSGRTAATSSSPPRTCSPRRTSRTCTGTW